MANSLSVKRNEVWIHATAWVSLEPLCEEERATEFFLNCPEEKAQGVQNECETGSDSGEHGVFLLGVM